MTETLTQPADRGFAIDEVAHTLTCVGIDDITHDVKSFTFALPGPLGFQAGQYVTVTVPVDGEEIQRCYTISSPPTRAESLTITVKRVPGGPVSNWLHDHLAVGDALRIEGPCGQFSYEFHPASRYLFLSAGSGVTPLMSMTSAIHDRGDPSHVAFVHNARTPCDIVFRGELDALGYEPNIAVTAICEGDAADEIWDGRYGRLTLPVLLRLAPDLYEREIFICGPPPYMEAVREMLRTAGVDPARCHEESFTLSPADPAPVDTPATDTYEIELRRSGRTVACDDQTTILEAVSRAGVVVPSSCCEGVCGTCKSDLLCGSVDMQHAGGIRPREIAAGKILLCCSTPQEDLVIDA